MSLKAKIEAVIYAAEEPVTLVQLASLLGQEAQAELDALDAAQQSLQLEGESSDPSTDTFSDANDPEMLNAEILEAVAEIEEEDAGEETELAESEEESDAEAIAAEGQPEPSVASALPPLERSSSEPEAPLAIPAEDGAARSEEAEISSEAAGSTSNAPGSVDPADATAADKRAERDRARRLREYFRSVLDDLVRDYSRFDRGLEIREVAGGFRLATKPEYHDAVRGFAKSLKPPLKLSLQALETLAVVAYKQPITAPEVSEIRGVDSGGVLGSLMARKLVATAGRKQVIGRPILYKTTKDFLLRFGLRDLNELPSIEEFERMAGELADTEPVQEKIPMATTIPGYPDPQSIPGTGVESPGQEPGTGGPIDSPPSVPDAPSQNDVTIPQPDGSGSALNAVEPSVDGRLSGVSRSGAAANEPVDSPAMDATIQADEEKGV